MGIKKDFETVDATDLIREFKEFASVIIEKANLDASAELKIASEIIRDLKQSFSEINSEINQTSSKVDK